MLSAQSSHRTRPDTRRLAQLREELEARLPSVGYELVEMRLGRAEGRRLIEVIIDSPHGVTADDCQTVSEFVDGWFEFFDPVECSYMLQVSSPGLDRPLTKLEHFQRFAGSRARVRLRPIAPEAEELGRKLMCRLLGTEGDRVLLEVEGQPVAVGFSSIDEAHIEYDWND